ncbi:MULTISPECIES: hypothetical protein [unclassified Pseudomonas]|uniref:hypothetical protein n=1 Tax=unclassified Pseudomonas TaxID=196821 RepID=UPI0002A26EED|nr:MULTISPECIES: hypothetical protein [unclassified Pseudomonas]MBB1606504.1 hypothetical protein [Pseudomonas sp. UMC76]MBB1640723.1 hypothetical protein [Pseudomonas sp. UME83]NTX88143.1 hypothetical protein [Pseudomonas sp. UMA643]NTY18716.1 hypothetical protein [Pseudomonas sp. UMC3103]NTY23980.1 hypothetical protein [Pseudomonas sp. UMA603]
MNAKLNSAQWAHDSAEQDDSLSWLSSSEWENLHFVCVDDLINKGFVRVAGKKVLEADILAIKVQKAAEDAIPGDHECNLGQLIVALEANNLSEAKRLMRCFIGRDRVRDIAGELVNAKEDEIYRLYMAAQEAA